MTTRLTAEKRREQLLEAAVDLFSRKGFNGTTTREIAQAAGVTEAIIFRHFATKEQLYAAIIDAKVHSIATADWYTELIQAMDNNDDRGVIERLISAIIRTHQLDPKFERVMLYAALERNQIALNYMRQATSEVVDRLSGYFKKRQRQGKFARIAPDAALNAVVGMAFHYAQTTYIHGVKEDCLTDEQAVESFTSIALNGLLKRP